ncbi:hypothetical protein Thexy_0041 [Thermoanaerobacterium xylanolyticum LX-11]|uniref:Response regulator receiver protein n=1 Tax=Thermoanaerobacterium xylanolyticum (strain ATCC 49914 / DSM 7097 / LX-11) TaxID=858215 RepID=F6BLC9_THEXL|nr:hypothetical protein [Thermoanaerobacterium xylanolyticum]AEF16105.1 hypothetical protein Thexy_0041 [Thermoanaerobacterium xylanolyticum LX-11]
MINIMVLGLYSLERQALTSLIEKDLGMNVIANAKKIADISTIYYPDIIIICDSSSYNYCLEQFRYIKSKKMNSKIILLFSVRPAWAITWR